MKIQRWWSSAAMTTILVLAVSPTSNAESRGVDEVEELNTWDGAFAQWLVKNDKGKEYLYIVNADRWTDPVSSQARLLVIVSITPCKTNSTTSNARSIECTAKSSLGRIRSKERPKPKETRGFRSWISPDALTIDFVNGEASLNFMHEGDRFEVTWSEVFPSPVQHAVSTCDVEVYRPTEASASLYDKKLSEEPPWDGSYIHTGLMRC